jgi:hypothetical protein
MPSKSTRALVASIACATFIATVGVVAAPAGASVAAKNAKFCAVLSTDQGSGIDFEGLSPEEAAFAAKLERKLAKTGVPAKLKKDLKKLAAVYDRIANGETAAEVLDADGQAAVLPALKHFSTYVAANCLTTPPST